MRLGPSLGLGIICALIGAPLCFSDTQDQQGQAERMIDSRAAQIEAQRREKAAHLEPETTTGIEHALQVIKEKKIVERIVGGTGGWRVRMGGLVTGAGFAIGPEYVRRDLLHDRMTFRTSLRGSTRKAWLADMELGMPRFLDNRAFIDLYTVHREIPHIDYYGPGAGSLKTGRSGFMLEDTSFQGRAGIEPVRHLKFGALGRYLLVNVGPGRDPRFVSTEQIYSESTTPGVRVQSDFLQGGGFVEFDNRDYRGEPRNGGNYIAQFTTYADRKFNLFSFDRLDLEAQQYFSFFNGRRVIALRGRINATDPHSGNVVPFYLQPTLGGPDDLRGFRPFRFYDNASLVMNGEYRWEVFSGLDMALFVDAGRVYHDWRQIDLNNLETDAGFGFRFNVRNDVFLRIDTGFSREGFQIWFKFGNVF